MLLISSTSSAITMITCKVLFGLLLLSASIYALSEFERVRLKNEAREMFTHAYDSYMKYAYPADELMPLSCKGRYRDREINRGDVDDSLGNFSLTLIDSIDTLVILGNYSEFEHAVYLIIDNVRFDSDIVVSVFETNIRVVGGLLSAHVLAQYVQDNHRPHLQQYQGELLELAKELGTRLLPAFDTPTGIPHPRINLKHGMNSKAIGSLRETCTSCAGTMILEFAALTRLTGDHIYEQKARRAMDYLWQQRHRQSDLVGNIININTGDWIRKESGVGAGIDSYYEYCLKAYILLGDYTYLYRFNRHYDGIMKYVSNGPFLLDVHMHRPHSQAKNFMDSLLAFWPGLQVLKGDLKPAIETHELLYLITQRHNFLPEAFTTDFNVHWPHHPLRPEFIESTYFLYQATNDPHYLEVGKEALANLQNFTRVQCGFAAVNDVRTLKKEDRMDSFVLAETFKYLYLLFSKKDEIDLNLDEYIFTTEAHLLPLSLSEYNRTRPFMFDPKSEYHCPCQSKGCRIDRPMQKNQSYFKNIRKNVKTFLDSKTTSGTSFSFRRVRKEQSTRLRATEFSALNPDHVNEVKKMGITVIVLEDGRVQLVHNSGLADSVQDAEDGTFFMQEMIALSKQQVQEDKKLRTVSFSLPSKLGFKPIKITLLAGPAQFGLDLDRNDGQPVQGKIAHVRPFDACKLEEIRYRGSLRGKIALVKRGECMFIEKARNVQHLGAIGMIVIDNSDNTSSKSMPMFSMSTDGSHDVSIASVFLFSEDAKLLLSALGEHPTIEVRLDTLTEELHQSLEKSSDHNLLEQFLRNTVKRVNVDNLEQIDLSTIMNMLKSNQLKFDLLKSLNEKIGEDHLSRIAGYWPNQFHLKLDILSNRKSHCGNPFRETKLFVRFMRSFLFLNIF